MPHVIEPAASGRSKCRGCGRVIARGELRFGEGLPNPYGEGDMQVWYHLMCAAYRRPEPFLDTLSQRREVVDDPEVLQSAAQFSLQHRRVCRIAGVERASSGRARCRACRELICRDALRIPLWFYEEGMFTASGFVHADCAAGYFEIRDREIAPTDRYSDAPTDRYSDAPTDRYSDAPTDRCSGAPTDRCTQLLRCLCHFTPGLTAADLRALEAALA